MNVFTISFSEKLDKHHKSLRTLFIHKRHLIDLEILESAKSEAHPTDSKFKTNRFERIIHSSDYIFLSKKFEKTQKQKILRIKNAADSQRYYYFSL